ncbi:hypothetical protein EJ08DRAFT_646723 [Tothia fuscella]|uniref:HTH CENPB-type domain-containing protein n=1 Tax=Tothia fuscella TaxID=1048955 RepID=A0A9P4U149_9PEZI|nr:hypothetical protein EJ08DRAFT_646723 [Tothia fuscella]
MPKAKSSAYAEEEVKVQAAIASYKAGEYKSVAAAAAAHNAKYDRVKGRMGGRISKSQRPGANKLLTEEEEKGLLLWMTDQDNRGHGFTKPQLERECNNILLTRPWDRSTANTPKKCGEHWAYRFVDAHPPFRLRLEHPKRIPLPPTEMETLMATTKTYVEEYMSHYDPSHDWFHIQRVLALAHRIEAAERVIRPHVAFDSDLITLSALLHDVGDRKYLQPGESGDSIVSKWLMEQGCDATFAGKVQLVVTNVSFTNETANMSTVQALCEVIPELAIVQDADRLDSIGAVGIGRLFAYGGAKCQDRGLSVEHFHTKLLRIVDRMKTPTGKALAKERTDRLRIFLGWWGDETKGVNLAPPVHNHANTTSGAA